MNWKFEVFLQKSLILRSYFTNQTNIMRRKEYFLLRTTTSINTHHLAVSKKPTSFPQCLAPLKYFYFLLSEIHVFSTMFNDSVVHFEKRNEKKSDEEITVTLSSLLLVIYYISKLS